MYHAMCAVPDLSAIESKHHAAAKYAAPNAALSVNIFRDDRDVSCCLMDARTHSLGTARCRAICWPVVSMHMLICPAFTTAGAGLRVPHSFDISVACDVIRLHSELADICSRAVYVYAQ